MAPSLLSTSAMCSKGLQLVGFDRERQQHWTLSRQESGTLKSHYGSLPIVYAYIWRDLQITTLASARIDAAKVDVECFLWQSNGSIAIPPSASLPLGSAFASGLR